MFCNNCGTQLEEGSRFCTNCGSRVDGQGAAGAAPDPAYGQPNASGGQPNASGGQPNASHGQPNASGGQPNASGGQPNASHGQPNASGGQPNASGGQPNASGGQPNASGGQPNASGGQPNASYWQPNASYWQSNASYDQPNLPPLQPVVNAAGGGKKGLRYVLAAAAAVVLLLAVGITAAALGVFSRGSVRVLSAIRATVQEKPQLVEDLRDIPAVLSGEQYTIGVDASLDAAAVTCEWRKAGQDRQVFLRLDGFDGDGLTLLGGVHSGVLKASLEGLDYVLVYDPRRENDGVIAETLDESTLEQLDDLLEDISADSMSAETLRRHLMAALTEEYRNLDFEKVRNHTFSVDGKDRKCQGYRVQVDEDDLRRVWDAFSGSVRDSQKDGGGELTEELLDIVDDAFRDLELEADLVFYLYQGKLAAVELESDETKLCLELRGGDYRMQHMVLSWENEYGDSQTITIRSEREGDTETTTIEGDGVEVTVAYEPESGRMCIESDLDGASCALEGVYRHSASEVSFRLDNFRTVYGSMPEDAEAVVYARKKAGVEPYRGEEFDLGSASWEDLLWLEGKLETYADALDALFW